jgi:hypothetical protein
MTTAIAHPSKKTSELRSLISDHVKQLCREATEACEDASQKCLRAGQALLELKATFGHGDFMEVAAREIPNVTHRTLTTWMRAAENITRALGPVDGAIEIESFSEILSTPDDELPQHAREWKQQWLDFTADKTIKECLNGVLVEGDEAHRVDRAINGKTKGGAVAIARISRCSWP